MARVTHVAKAQQRYETVPVIDPVTGEQKRTPVMVNGVQKVSKRGPVFMNVTVRDETKPLPPYKCDYCGEEIKVGTPYKHVSPKSGPYGGHKKTRHESCPSWQPWDLSSSWSARVAQVVDGFDVGDAESPEDVTAMLDDLAGEIEGLADESDEAASNIEDGFGHETAQSQEAAERADQLRDWATEIRDADIPDLPEPEEEDCPECGGTGKIDNPDFDPEVDPETGAEAFTESEIDCQECDNGQITPEEPSDVQMEEWREEAQSACDDAIGNSPV
jgi:hypothetical protein